MGFEVSSWLIWFVVGIALAFLELQLPGFVVLFFGLGAWVVATALLIFDLSLAQQILLFLVASVGSVFALRSYFVRIFRGQLGESDGDELDEFPHEARVPVTRKITPHADGRVLHRGTHWDATADEDIDEGEIVELIRYADRSRLRFFVTRVATRE